MQTSASNSSIDFNVQQSTTSNNSNINVGTDTANSQSIKNTSINNPPSTETLDLSSEVEPESKGILGSIGDGLSAAKNAIGDGLSAAGKAIGDAGATVVDGAKSAANWAVNGLKGAGATLAETAANLAGDVDSILAKAEEMIDSNPVTSALADVASTGAVITTSVYSGVLKLREIAEDGVEWAGCKVIEGGSWLVGEVAGVFSEDVKEDITNWREDISTRIKEDIARDKVSELNELFYEKTGLGRWVNGHSAIKYDSEIAMKIRGASEVAAEIAAATALTVATGGAAAPFIVGALVGAGKAAESTYQNNGTDTTWLQELGIAGSGALTGLTWMANGKLGQGALEIGKDVIANGGMTVLKDMGAQLFNKEFVVSKLKDGLFIRNGGKFNLNALLNYGQAAMGTAGALTPYITGEEEFDATAALKIGGTFLGYLGLNVLEDTARDYVSNYKSAETLAEVASKISTDSPEVEAKLAADTTAPPPDKTIVPTEEELRYAAEWDLRAADDFDLMKIKRGAPVLDSGLEIYSKGIDLGATAHQIPIDMLLRIAKDPDYAAQVLDGDLLDEIDGITRLEIGNALQDLKTATTRFDLDLGIDEAGLGRIDECIKKLSGDPKDVLVSIIAKMAEDPAAQNLDWEYFTSEDGKRMIKYLKDINEFGTNTRLPNGMYTATMLDVYHARLINGVLNQRINPTQEEFIEVVTELLRNDSIENYQVKILKDIMDTNGYSLYEGYSTAFAEYIKRANLDGVEDETIQRLRRFTGGYVSEEKLRTIHGSCEFETSAQFAKRNHPDWSAFNDGEKSVMSLGFPEDQIRLHVNHESLHHVSNSNWNFDPQTGQRISKSGVQLDVWDGSIQEWRTRRAGINESITELFNKLSMGDEYPADPHCGYSDGVERLEQLLDTGIITVDELKQWYFGNSGEILERVLNQRTARLGLGELANLIVESFDGAISNDDATLRSNSLNALTRIIKDIAVATESGATQPSGRGFLSILRGLFS